MGARESRLEGGGSGEIKGGGGEFAVHMTPTLQARLSGGEVDGVVSGEKLT